MVLAEFFFKILQNIHFKLTDANTNNVFRSNIVRYLKFYHVFLKKIVMNCQNLDYVIK